MKKLINKLLLLSFCLTIFSCSNEILNTKPLDKYSEKDVWTDVIMAQGFVYDTYNSVINLYIQNKKLEGSGSYMNAHLSDDFTRGISNVVVSDQLDKFYDAGWDVFGEIRKCNLIIQKVKNSDGIAEKYKKGLIAEGRVLRALVYFRQARIFGKYPIIDKVLTPDDDLKVSRSNSIKELYDFIINDLQKAAEDLPIEATQGKITKGVAMALQAEVALHGAAYIEKGKEEYYQICKTASEDLFGLGIYELDTNYKLLFNNYDHAYDSKETILAYFMHIDATKTSQTAQQFLVPNVSNRKIHDWAMPKFVESMEGWARGGPSVELVDNYLVIDVDNKAKKWNETSYYHDFMENGGYVSSAIYKNRDRRFYASVAYDSTQYYSNLITTRIGGNLHPASRFWTNGQASGYFPRKGIYEDKKLWGPDNVWYHYHLLRLGRAYLNYAEVLLRLGQTSNAIEYINKTRVTHGGLPKLSSGLSNEEAWEWYKIERRVELFFENDRYWTLLRWGKEDGGIVIPELNNNNVKTIEIAADGQSFEIVPLKYDIPANTMVFTKRKYLLPVPEQEILLNGNLDQNPGW